MFCPTSAPVYAALRRGKPCAFEFPARISPHIALCRLPSEASGEGGSVQVRTSPYSLARSIGPAQSALPANSPRFYARLRCATPWQALCLGNSGAHWPLAFLRQVHFVHSVRFKKSEVIVQKYPDRCLFLVSGECAMYCRFCTRKRKFQQPFIITQKDIDEGLHYIHQHRELRDVLISGGDPFMLDDDALEYILHGIKTAEHIRMIRIGTRTPGVLPERITAKLVKMLKKYHPLYINIHFNHPDEITPATCRALKRLADAGIVLGSQTVLLKGINDDPEVMRELMWKLLENRVRPYYIFQCDLVYGTEHFRTPLCKAREIIQALRGWSSGMANPHLVIDLPGGGGKVPVSVDYLQKSENGKLFYRNYCGEEYIYPDVTEK
ncbi:MAG: KamA family radical SAM protein [Lentisphaeria bacterium]|nr:KamA family radical SAM protein [Lentisphaeria bacterium]